MGEFCDDLIDNEFVEELFFWVVIEVVFVFVGVYFELFFDVFIEFVVEGIDVD